MIRHVVLFTWKDGTNEEQMLAVVEALKQLPAAIPQLRDYQFGPDLGISDDTADFAVVADCASVDDWRAYIDHPEHQRVVREVVAPIRESRIALQYEIEG